MKTTLPLALTTLSTLAHALPQLVSTDVGYPECFPAPSAVAPTMPGPLPADACAAAISSANSHLSNVTNPFTSTQNGTFLSFPDPTGKCAVQIGLLCPLALPFTSLDYKPQLTDLIAKANTILGKCPKGGLQSLQTNNLQLSSQNLGWYVELTTEVEDQVVAVTQALFGKLNQAVQTLTNSTIFKIPAPPQPPSVAPPIFPDKPAKPALQSILTALGIHWGSD